MEKKSNTLTHERSCDDCKEFEHEHSYIKATRLAINKNMRNIFREELNNDHNNNERLKEIDKWMWKVGSVYWLTITVVFIIIYLILDKIYP